MPRPRKASKPQLEVSYVHNVELRVAYDIDEVAGQVDVSSMGEEKAKFYCNYIAKERALRAVRDEIAYTDLLLKRRLERKFKTPFEVTSCIVGEEWRIP
jgi:hypothetical protein